MKEALVTFMGGMAFNARVGSGHEILMDAVPEVGGENKGPRPTELLLAALGGCTGIDVVSILRKKRVEFDRFDIAIEADSVTEYPKYFNQFRLVYRLWGSNVDVEGFKRAVELSQEKYCSVSGLFKKGAAVTYRLEVNGEPIA